MQKTLKWGGDEGGVEWREVKVVSGERGLRQGCPLLPLLFNIYLMEMAEELEGA